MRIFQRYSFSIPKKQKTGELVRGVFDLIEKNNWNEAKVLFQFSDMMQSNVSAQKRIVKNFPVVQDFCVEAPAAEERQDPISSLGNLWGTAKITNIPERTGAFIDPRQIRQVAPEVLIEIAEGIGRRFPLQTALFIFWGVPAATENPSRDSLDGSELPLLPELGAYGLAPRPFISVVDSWWVNGRMKSMTAGLELPLPEQTAATVQVPEDQEQVLSSLAKIKERQLVCFPTAQELETQEEVHEMISPLLAAYKKLMQDRESYLAKLNLPHAASFSNSEPGSEPEIIPKKKIIQSHLKKLGYKHYGPGGGQGLMCFRKCTSNNNIISIHFDFGTWSKSLHAALHFRGPLTEFSINLLYSNDEKRLLGISSATVFGQAIENLSKVIEAVEKDLITEIEKQLPATPVWYASVV